MHTFRKQVELRVVCGTMITRCTVLPTICNCTVYTVQCYLQFAIAQCYPQNFRICTESARTMMFPPRPFELWGNIVHKAVGDHNLFIVFGESSNDHLIIITFIIIEAILNCGVIIRARQGPMSGVRENLDRQEGRVCHRRKVGNCIFFKMQHHVLVFILNGICLHLFFLVRIQRVFFIGPQLYNVVAQIM